MLLFAKNIDDFELPIGHGFFQIDMVHKIEMFAFVCARRK